ncbi:tetratricopeptide repeat protein [Cecembia rubra]|uniref:tetratricopeptide repeat protein n=1 Tax=Cecembia rubra TaxID=1485585 RepID=UPI002714805C|nr:tetratricopeptide repeat protein [Cecembia rubra]
MSKLSRIEMLQSFAEQEPENPFNWYALALEYQNSYPENAATLFHKLLKEHKGYLPTYYHAAHFFAEYGDLDLAKTIYEEGIVLAEQEKQEKTLRELKNSYQNFLFENDLGD